MPLTSAITPYDPRWLAMYDEARSLLSPIFGPQLVDMQHIGSTAVPGLAAKPEIDILAVIACDELHPDWIRSLLDHGYQRGRDLTLGHHFFKRDAGGVRTHKLHVCQRGHPAIAELLRFRDHLRRNPVDRQRYEDLKLRLERENREGIAEYLAAKRPFIKAMLNSLE